MTDVPVSTSALNSVGEYAQTRSQKSIDNNESDISQVVTNIDDRVSSELDAYQIGRGSSRIAYTHTDWDVVLKLGINTHLGDGTEQNRVESYLWNHMPSNMCDNFFPVQKTGSEYAWLIMDKAMVTNNKAMFNESRAQTSMGMKFPSLPPNNEFMNVDNIGVRRDTDDYAVLDYGSYIPIQFFEVAFGNDAEQHIENVGTEHISGHEY